MVIGRPQQMKQKIKYGSKTENLQQIIFPIDFPSFSNFPKPSKNKKQNDTVNHITNGNRRKSKRSSRNFRDNRVDSVTVIFFDKGWKQRSDFQYNDLYE